MPARLTPLEPLTPQALVTGDPRRAFALAQSLTVQPKMSHQARGLWGYTGVSAGGFELTLQATGIGGPSAVAVLMDLAELGVRRVIRLGTCVAPAGGHRLGQPLLVESAIGRDGTSSALTPGGRALSPDAGLLALLEGIAPAATVSSHDFAARNDPAGTSPAPGATVRDLQTAATLAVAPRSGLQAAAVLVVAGRGDEEDLRESDLNELLIEVGREVVSRLEKSTV